MQRLFHASLLLLSLPGLTAPLSGQNTLFRIAQDTICPSVSVQPSNITHGASHYEWSFGDGRASDKQDPGPIMYAKTGSYSLRLRLQTRGGQRLLDSVHVLKAAGWNEFPNLDALPDFYAVIASAGGERLYASGVVPNQRPPVKVPTAFLLTEEQYLLSIYDSDAIGRDDLMGTVILDGSKPAQTLVGGNLQVSYSAGPARAEYIDSVRVTVILPTLTVAGDSIRVRFGNGPPKPQLSITWYHNGKVIPGIPSNTTAIHPAEPGRYQAKLYFPGLCNDLSTELEWPVILSASEEIVASESDRLFPNPALAGQLIHYDVPGDQHERVTVSIFDLTGRQLYAQPYEVGASDRLLRFPAPVRRGNWIVKVTSDTGKSRIMRLLTQ